MNVAILSMNRNLRAVSNFSKLGLTTNTQCSSFSTITTYGKSEGRVTIGDVTKKLKVAKLPELIPLNYVTYDEDGKLKLTQSALHHLRWMMQKDELRQDMFLLGYPGPLRRTLVMQYLELTQRELEYIALSRDTTESDLKQRREIKNREAIYYDQCAVRAAIHGRVLVLDGVEHAERNVLPILNNLLENREMHLENGKFLIAPDRYNKLLESYSKEELDKWGLVRVSEDFRVIALGLPSERYKGTPLDPPLRSRFQARNVPCFSYEELFAELTKTGPKVELAKLKQLLSFALSTLSSESLNLPDFPVENLHKAIQIMNSNPNISTHEAICFLYPYKSILQKENIARIQNLLNLLKIKTDLNSSYKSITSKKNNTNLVTFSLGDIRISIPGGQGFSSFRDDIFVDLDYQKNILAKMIQVYAAGDICLLGPKGIGKSTLTNQLIKSLNQSIEPMVLYEDMMSRDLIQQRTTTLNGDTIWRDSALVRAAKNGYVAVLDGIDRLHKSTITVLQRLIIDRELQLCDGGMLLRSDKYKNLLSKGFTKEMLTEKKIYKIQDAFKIVALAEPPKQNTTNKWLGSELLSLFTFVEMRPLYQNEELYIITELYGQADENIQKIIRLSHILRESTDPIYESLAETLSTRQLLKVARRLKMYPAKDDSFNSLYDMLQHVFLAKFLPALPRNALENALKEANIKNYKKNSKNQRKIEVKNSVLRIGNTEMKINKSNAESKIPNTLFFEVPQHVDMLEYLLQNFLSGDHLLLVGNQGVGKNKLVDKLLQVMNKPREYLQLHRDTTVHSLTVQSTLRDGMVVFEDSPLIKAVKNGHVLVIDEVDKAPVNVTCILRTLVENGEMILSDGRKIVPYQIFNDNSMNIIKTHPDFRLIVLANRPGFPFLGNDFFASLGDVFSCVAVDNPSPESEIFLLQQYAPSVPKRTLSALVNAFGDLRSLADEGILNYPYSTREVVNIAKHLEKYPDETMSELIGNVLDFDKYSPDTLEQVTDVLIKHGLPVEAYAKNELFSLRSKKEIQLTIERESGLDVAAPKHGKVGPSNEPHIGGNTWAGGTGGRDTAGLGGKGGPYRLDAGHTVHQLSDAEKDAVPEEIKRAAREMNRKAFEEKLKEIRMSEYDYKIYSQFNQPIKKQVQQLKSILNALQTKSTERQWKKYQTSGELDDTRLIEGIAGEKNIYRKRTNINPWADQIREKPKKLKLVVDVSGSMYRFNSYDGRLDRQLEAVVMVMEAFEGFESKILYEIVGHSGEGYNISFVKEDNPPKNDKERLETLRMMHAHSQFCWPGDHTLLATTNAIESLIKENNDDSIVIIMSDANLSRYAIPPKDLSAAIMKGEPKVKGYVIFIGSLSKEADLINVQMPAGHSYICMDLTLLPQILKQIFTSSLL